MRHVRTNVMWGAIGLFTLMALAVVAEAVEMRRLTLKPGPDGPRSAH